MIYRRTTLPQFFSFCSNWVLLCSFCSNWVLFCRFCSNLELFAAFFQIWYFFAVFVQIWYFLAVFVQIWYFCAVLVFHFLWFPHQMTKKASCSKWHLFSSDSRKNGYFHWNSLMPRNLALINSHCKNKHTKLFWNCSFSQKKLPQYLLMMMSRKKRQQ